MRLHSFLWALRWAFWHVTLQYHTDLHAVHFLRRQSLPRWPHDAQLFDSIFGWLNAQRPLWYPAFKMSCQKRYGMRELMPRIFEGF